MRKDEKSMGTTTTCSFTLPLADHSYGVNTTYANTH